MIIRTMGTNTTMMIMSGDEIPDRLPLHALADPRSIEAMKPWIEMVLRTIFAPGTRKHQIAVCKSTGWISYIEPDELWRERPPALPRDLAAARSIAEGVLVRLMSALSVTANDTLERNTGVQSLLPALMQPVELKLVAHPQRIGQAAHWLYRAQPMIPLGNGKRAAVFGADLAVRIGDGGRIIAFHSNYRPLTAERINARHTPFASAWANMPLKPGHGGAEGGHDHGHSGHSGEGQHRLVYVQEGQGIPQYYLAPFYMLNAGHIFTMVSASAWSLTGVFTVTNSEESTEVSLVVSGGSGEYQFEWARMDEARFADGVIFMGAGSSAVAAPGSDFPMRVGSVTLPLVNALMMVNVRDARTGAFAHFQRQIGSDPAAQRRSLVLPTSPFDGPSVAPALS